MMLPEDYFDLHQCVHRELFQPDAPVWTAIDRLRDYLASFFRDAWPLAGRVGMVEKPIIVVDGKVRDDLAVRPSEDAAIIMPGAYLFDDEVIIGARTVVEPEALIKGPTVLGADTEVRQGAYIRGNCLIGSGCVVGHATEIKNSIMLDGSKAGHFAYIGDSILGKNVNLGAGTKLANLKMIPGTVVVAVDEKDHDTGRRKLGAILGDRTVTGCNSVTSPGTLMGPDSIVYSVVSVPGGYYPENSCVRPARGFIQRGTRLRGRRE